MKLVNKSTGGVANTVSTPVGLFVFPSVLAGSYDLTIESPGFQQYQRTAIELTASEIRDLGTVSLTIGESRSTISVVDTAAALQYFASGEKAGVVTGRQLNQPCVEGPRLHVAR